MDGACTDPGRRHRFSNIAQDEIGHALVWYTILHEHLGQPQPDRMAFWREASRFPQCHTGRTSQGRLATIVRQYLFDEYEARDACSRTAAFTPSKMPPRKSRARRFII
jgi:1,2-phenylacetyl-CoA epoxidase catalytic subunit